MTLTQAEKRRGGGPWEFASPELSPGETWRINLRNRRFNGTNGWFRKWLPLDFAQINNNNQVTLSLILNNEHSDTVLPTTTEAYDSYEYHTLAVTNESSGTTLAAGAVTLVLAKQAYGADQRAREQASRPWLQRAMDDLIPGGLPGGPNG